MGCEAGYPNVAGGTHTTCADASTGAAEGIADNGCEAGCPRVACGTHITRRDLHVHGDDDGYRINEDGTPTPAARRIVPASPAACTPSARTLYLRGGGLRRL